MAYATGIQFVGDALWAHAKMGCYVCGRGDSLVDLGVLIEGEGALVICKGCVQQAAEAAELTFNEAVVREDRVKLQDAERRLSQEGVLVREERIKDLEAQLAETQVALAVAQQVEARMQDALSRQTRPAAHQNRRTPAPK